MTRSPVAPNSTTSSAGIWGIVGLPEGVGCLGRGFRRWCRRSYFVDHAPLERIFLELIQNSPGGDSCSARVTTWMQIHLACVRICGGSFEQRAAIKTDS